ncbi:ATP-binding protein [Endozoicomonas ascidiicola]|uniref:ATP-binding protein n=1 Tax=Endozoicomonas ascidiicola TaxID=1698521 RepID=UPI00082C51FE|nr:ATP-binding protein [Endozoicomonas ascidiicola]
MKRLTGSLKSRAIIALSILLGFSFSLILLSVLESFDETIDQATREQMASNANALMAAAAKEVDGQLLMPERTGVKRFDKPNSDTLRGYIFSADGKLLWQSISSNGKPIDYQPVFDLDQRVELTTIEMDGKTYLVYEVDTLLGSSSSGYCFVTLVPAKKYLSIVEIFTNHLRMWVSIAVLLVVAVCWMVLWWSLKPFREVEEQISEIESGHRDSIEGSFPSEVKRLTDSINTLIISEQKQRQKYRTTMDDLAHSLKTPLAVLQSFSSSLKIQSKAPNEAEIVNLCKNINSQVQRMNQIIGYHLHRSVTGHHGLLRQSVQVEPVVNELKTTLEKVYSGKQINFITALDPSCIFHGDEDDLLEMLGNLLTNAFKFCYNTVSLTGYVESKQHNQPARLTLLFDDDGSGIDQEDREQVFHRGIRADCEKPGQGIGLAVVKDLVEGYQGHIIIEDSSLGGARIKLILPTKA